MEAYKYSSDSGIYSGIHQCQPDPVGGGFLDPPANCTKVKPPDVNKWENAFWNGESWEIKPDNMGRRIYNKSNGSPEYCQFYEIPDGYTTIAPDVSFPKWDEDKWVVDDSKKKESEEAIVKSSLSSVDSKSIRSLRAVLLAVVRGETIPQDDFDFLVSNENEAKAERDKL